MHYKQLLTLFFFIAYSSCTSVSVKNEIRIIEKETFSNKGFTLVYSNILYDEKIISNKLQERELIIFQRNLKKNTQVKISNILNNKKIDINQHSTRNLISADDVLVVASYLVESKIYINEITNIATPSNMLVVDIIKIIEDITGSLLSYNLVDSGQIFDIDIEKIRNVNMDFNIFSPRYLENTLRVFFKNTFFLK